MQNHQLIYPLKDVDSRAIGCFRYPEYVIWGIGYWYFISTLHGFMVDLVFPFVISSNLTGHPGSGKTAFCSVMSEYLGNSGRKVGIVNLDPANRDLKYDCVLDISDLITLEDAMTKHDLGPNGGLLYCMKFLENNIEWLEKLLKELMKERTYLLFDCPGQVELYSLNDSMKRIFKRIESLGLRLCAISLTDSVHVMDPPTYISVLLLSLSFMLQLELPHLNVLSKTDLIDRYGPFAFDMKYYQNALDLDMLSRYCIEGDEKFSEKYAELTRAIVAVVEDFSLVSFQMMSILEPESVENLAILIDRTLGYA